MRNTHWVMDYETLVNCFVAVFVDYKDSNIKHLFVVCDQRNDFPKFVTFLERCVTNKEWHISYNGLAFDGQISQFILELIKLKLFTTLLKSLYKKRMMGSLLHIYLID